MINKGMKGKKNTAIDLQSFLNLCPEAQNFYDTCQVCAFVCSLFGKNFTKNCGLKFVGKMHHGPTKMWPLSSFNHISNSYNFFAYSVEVILVPYCCLFYVLSNDMLNISYRHILVEDTCTNIKVTQTNCT